MKLTKDKNHSHYWIENGILGESYHTLRGLRYRELCEVDLPDNLKVSDEELEKYDPVALPNGQVDKEEPFQSFKENIKFRAITPSSYDGTIDRLLNADYEHTREEVQNMCGFYKRLTLEEFKKHASSMTDEQIKKFITEHYGK